MEDEDGIWFMLHISSPHFSPVGEMFAQRFGFTRNFLKGEAHSAERPNQGWFGQDLQAEQESVTKQENTGCISDCRKLLVDAFLWM